jgi:hypothetical protein
MIDFNPCISERDATALWEAMNEMALLCSIGTRYLLEKKEVAIVWNHSHIGDATKQDSGMLTAFNLAVMLPSHLVCFPDLTNLPLSSPFALEVKKPHGSSMQSPGLIWSMKVGHTRQ